ncbi:Dihydrosphingosine 1-phosphate phosphatase [Smittium mucronatum]|uniref:Dihydrosphingosine 1-phosphate phosphatase n=1 Tax=Smittium mucronatum TaxID=133383 RepID=A0A1R0H747_9FUNG|nr:Dihydrosphingosine 1-phosphate phosphatase [Smittium mucronatum]
MVVAVACDHVFFTYMLPLLFLFGLGSLARGLAIVVLLIVALTGWVKDYVSTLRPKSPPIVRKSLNHLHELEYGFPSTHSSYAVGTAAYLTILALLQSRTESSEQASLYLISIWALSISVLIGRVYCGMHSLIDVYGGAIMGMLVSLPLSIFYTYLDDTIFTTYRGSFIIAAISFVLLYNHPLFYDQCLCYRDTFSAVSVINGVVFGSALYSTFTPPSEPYSKAIYFSLAEFGFLRSFYRTLFGLLSIAAWKYCSTPFLIRLVSPFNPLDRPKDNKNMFGTASRIFESENLARIPIYFGIGFNVVFVVPWLFFLLNI